MNLSSSLSGLDQEFPDRSFSLSPKFTSRPAGNDSANASLARGLLTQPMPGRFTSPVIQIDVWDQRSANPIGRRPTLLFMHFALAPSLRRQLQELRRLGRGWDGDDADPVRPGAVQAAEELLWAFSMARGKFLEPSIIPKYDGFLQLEWHDGTRSLEFELVEEGWIVMGTDESAGVRRYYGAHAQPGSSESLIPFYRWFVQEEWLWPSL